MAEIIIYGQVNVSPSGVEGFQWSRIQIGKKVLTPLNQTTIFYVKFDETLNFIFNDLQKRKLKRC